MHPALPFIHPGTGAVMIPPPPNNAKALAAYRCALYGLIPVLGLLMGPLALALGILGWRHFRKVPDDRGAGHAVTGIVLGTLELLSNGIGLAFIIIGLTSFR
jgi:hypothetical protein